MLCVAARQWVNIFLGSEKSLGAKRRIVEKELSTRNGNRDNDRVNIELYRFTFGLCVAPLSALVEQVYRLRRERRRGLFTQLTINNGTEYSPGPNFYGWNIFYVGPMILKFIAVSYKVKKVLSPLI